MAYSYKTYSDMKDVMKKFVNASEGSVIYSLGKTRFMTLAKEAHWLIWHRTGLPVILS